MKLKNAGLTLGRKENFYRVALGVIDRYYGDASSEFVILGQFFVPLAVGYH